VSVAHIVRPVAHTLKKVAGAVSWGYESGKRDITKAKCKMKVCCFKDKRLETCADCRDYPCKILQEFWSKKGWKYQ